MADDKAFDLFWETFPRNNGSKKIARQRWVALSAQDRDDALGGAVNYAKSRKVLEGDLRYIKHADAWLSGRFWEAWQRPEAPLADPAKQTYGFDPAITRNLYGPAYGSKLPEKAKAS